MRCTVAMYIALTLQVTVTFTYGMEFYYLDNHLQSSYKVVTNINTLQKIPQPCDNHITTSQGCSKVAIYNLEISI